jgi:hypothetical protein
VLGANLSGAGGNHIRLLLGESAALCGTTERQIQIAGKVSF